MDETQKQQNELDAGKQAAEAIVEASKPSWFSLQGLDTINPASWFRWGFGGSKPGCGLW